MNAHSMNLPTIPGSKSSGDSSTAGLSKRLQTVLRLNNSIATNAYGMPRVIYKADQIPADHFERPPKEQHHILDLATVEVTYAEGLPVIADHGLLWEQLPWEPADAYLAFSSYIKLQESHGYRALNLLLNEHPTSNLPQDRLTDPDVRKERQEFIELMREYMVFYCWSLRARAFDMLAQAAYERLRERRALQTENYHYLQTDNMVKKLVGMFEEVFDNADKRAELSIPDFVRAMKTVIELQRVTVGLPATAPLPISEQQHPDSPHGHTLETRLKLQARRQAAVEESDNNTDKNLETVMADPQLLAMAQELIVRTMKEQQAQPAATATATQSELVAEPEPLSESLTSDQTDRSRRPPDEESRVESGSADNTDVND